MSSCGWVVASPPRRCGPHRQGDGRRSVHKSVEMASRGRFGAFVYTVAPWAWVVGSLGIAIVYTNGRIGPLRAVLGRLCTLLDCCEQPWGRRSVHKPERTRHLDGSPMVCVHYRPAGRTAQASAVQNSPYHLSVTTGTATRHSRVRPRRRFHAMWLLARPEGACSPLSSPSR